MCCLYKSVTLIHHKENIKMIIAFFTHTVFSMSIAVE